MTWQSEADKHVNSPVMRVAIYFNSGTRYYSFNYMNLYKGNILKISKVSSSVGGVKRTYERNKAYIIFNDTDYEFRGLAKTETVGFKNIEVTIDIPFEDDDYANPLTIFTGLIYSWKKMDNLQFRIDMAEKSKNLENEYPWKRVELGDYANADDTAVGWVVPVPYGEISASGLSDDGAFGHPALVVYTGLPFIDTTQDAEQHLVGVQTEAITVDRVYIDGALKTEGVAADYTISTQTIDGMVHTEIHWNALVRPTADNLISCDITFGSRRPIEGIWHFLYYFCGYTDVTWIGGVVGDDDDRFDAPHGITHDGTHLYLADSNNHRIMKRKCSDLSYVLKIGSVGSGNDEFNLPKGICTDDTYIYVVDSQNHRIVKRNCSDLAYVAKIGSQGSGNDQFEGPYGICTDGTYLYVADAGNHRIVKRNCVDLAYVSKIGSNGNGNDQFNNPRGICTDDTYLYIMDMGNHRLVKRNCSDLAYVAKIGSSGSGDDQFTWPEAISTDGTSLYIGDSGNARLMKRLCSDLSYVSKIGTLGKADDKFYYPAGITDDGTYIYISDTSNDEILKRNASDLSYLPGEFNRTNYWKTRIIENTRGYDFAGALWEKATLRTILDRWREEYELDIYWNKDGELCFKYLKATFATGANHYKDYLHILKTFETDSHVDKIVNKIKYGYIFNWSKTYYYDYATYENTASQTKYDGTFKKFAGFQWVRTASVALDLAIRKILRFKDPLTLVTLDLPLRTFSDNLADPLRITHFCGSGSAGYNNTLFQLRQQTFDLDRLISQVVLEDASNYTGRGCILGDDTQLAASWAAADADDRQYCYMCDMTTEEFSDGEPGKYMLD